ncbi:DUF421 domain-containing protein [Herbidospora mongoliensis]|uniref:DUF421 domain-containing protein n=1 Tax=Herbidospora mongoliensis TaxID=688067 RepID=UPI000830EDB4|nr:YetF domain-containing protein [Herbidospora mongoliensis]
MNDLLVLGVPVLDKVIRTVAVYLCVVILLRLVGKRDMAQLNTFDLVVMLLLSNVVQNAIIGPDNSVLGGIIGAVVLVTGNAMLTRAAAEWGWLAKLFESKPTVLARDGAYDDHTLKRLGLRHSDLDVAIKRQGGTRVEDVSEATLEPGGTVVVRLRPEEENATLADIARLEERLVRIEALLMERRKGAFGP